MCPMRLKMVSWKWKIILRCTILFRSGRSSKANHSGLRKLWEKFQLLAAQKEFQTTLRFKFKICDDKSFPATSPQSNREPFDHPQIRNGPIPSQNSNTNTLFKTATIITLPKRRADERGRGDFNEYSAFCGKCFAYRFSRPQIIMSPGMMLQPKNSWNYNVPE